MQRISLIALAILMGCTQPDTQPPPPVGSVVMDTDYASINILHQPLAPPPTAEAKAAGVSGTVKLEMTISPTGTPTKAFAISGPEPLRKMAEMYAMQFRFEPVLLRGNPQFARFTMPMPIIMLR